jgi:hypothetical protein
MLNWFRKQARIRGWRDIREKVERKSLIATLRKTQQCADGWKIIRVPGSLYAYLFRRVNGFRNYWLLEDTFVTVFSAMRYIAAKSFSKS